jgi:hypothetical protein
VDFDSLDCGRKLIAERVFGRARLKIVGGNHLGRRQRIAYDRYMDKRGKRMWDFIIGLLAQRQMAA